jgi:phosphomannomutase
VPEQAEPDAAFPTLVFPNPEEPGALDLGCAFATAERADLLIASDPDADRLAVAVPDVEHPDGWRRLTGNEIGLLLGWDAASRAAGTGAVLASSLVSSPGLARIAAHFGLTHVETFTGFKWISRVPGLVYGYEEALGYLVNPETVRDKDGISAAVRFVALAQHWRSEGSTVDDALDTVAEEIGADASGQVSIRVTDLAEITRSADRLRSAPPAELAGRAVVATRDYRDDAEQRADILRFDLADGSRVIVRPSGTEPKLKIYLDTHAFDGTGRARRRAAAAAVAELEQSVRSLLA